MVVIVFFSIIVLFFLFLSIKEIFDLDICAVCLSVSGSWVIFLILYWLFDFDLTAVILFLMGGSGVGLFYWLKDKETDKDLFNFFQLPILLTIFSVLYGLVDPYGGLLSFSVVLFTWIIFGIIYLFQEKSEFLSKSVKKIIKCCKDW